MFMEHSIETVIQELIATGKESEYVDFKLKTYGSNLSNSELVKDIAAFANGRAKGDKYIVFGVNDETKEIVGLTEESIDSSTIENCVAERIEPRMVVECGCLSVAGKTLAYIRIPEKNDNPPYVIKKDGGKNNSIRQGDIYVRVGTCNRKANREDLDRMYRENEKMVISVYENYFYVGPIQARSRKRDTIATGCFDVELYNPTSRPIILCEGSIRISNPFATLERIVWGFDPLKRFEESPYTIGANCREIKKIYFDFQSADCIALRFEEIGTTLFFPKIEVALYDTERNEYRAEVDRAYVFARGAVLHIIERYYKEFREKLKHAEPVLVSIIKESENMKLQEVFEQYALDFSFVQPGYELGHPEFPEYDVLYSVIKTALECNNVEALQILRGNGLPEEFIEYTNETLENRNK